MNIMRVGRVSLQALSRNKMRSFLTALGIIIGVGAVIAMVSIGQGAKNAVQDRFNSMGTNLLFVSAGSRSIKGVHTERGAGYNTLKPDDAIAIQEKCDAVKLTSPAVQSRAQVVFGNKNVNTSINGCGASYPEIRVWEVEYGTFFDEDAVQSAAKVCILGSEVKKNLFEDQDPIGQIIRIRKIPFRVLGVFKQKGETGSFMSRDDVIAVPYTTVMKKILRRNFISSIDVSAVSAARTAEAKTQIEELLRIRHKIQAGAPDDFAVGNMSEIAEGAEQTFQILTILLGGIAGVSLLVGGIGIMNIMLVSVTERIREIGIRMSVGARERDILLQFLTEAVVLSVLGGVIGILVGYGGSKLISKLGNFKTLVSMGSVILALGFSGSVGIFFGFYPARKASRLDPIDALRYE